MIKQYRSEYAVPAAVAVSVCLLWIIAEEAIALREITGSLTDELNIDSELVRDIIKIICISYARKIGCDMCTDFGYKAIADKVDIFGRFAAAAVIIPKLHSLYVDIIKLL
ncbi:MAG: hypothetical protein IJ460_00500 [Clostridia bacterium]|nr:hypothetical protein [Clostridia bacterium]